MKHHYQQLEKGQVLVIFVLLLFGLLALSALVIDGGQTFVHRRQAQAAADSGAMAGAYAICQDGATYTEASSIAENYAMVENLATEATASITTNASGQMVVKVDVGITQHPFFAQLLGFPPSAIPATASAACFTSSTVMPIAWSCKEGSSYPDCFDTVEWSEVQGYIAECEAVPGNAGNSEKMAACLSPKVSIEPVIFMDSDELNVDHCLPSGTINCDVNGDGKNDFNVMAGRSWIALLGKGTSSLGEVLANGVNPPLQAHDWVISKSGAASAGYDLIIKCILGEGKNLKECNAPHNPVLLPVMNHLCKADDPLTDIDCQYWAHINAPAGTDRKWCAYDDPGCAKDTNDIYYHVVGFTHLYVTCVQKQPNSDKCPAGDLVNDLVVGGKKPYKNMKTIEGYFITGFSDEMVDPVNCGLNFGACSASLTN